MEVVTEKPTTKGVPEGYKRTEVGIIPREWKILKLDDYTTKIGSGITPRGGRKVYTAEGRPFIRSQNVDWGYLNLEELAFIDEKTHKSFDATELLEDDVLLNITGASIGRSAMVTVKIVGGNVNQHVCLIRTSKDYIEPKYLNYVLISNIGQDQVASHQAGGNREGLNFGQIGKFKIPTPPTLEEQQAIAEALSDADALITELDALIEKKQQIKKGAMQQLLTGKKRLPGFDGVWKEKKLGDVLTVMHGKSQRSVVSESGDYPILGTSGQIGKATSYLYDKPSVLIGRKGTIDRPQYMDEPFWTIDTLFYTHVNENAIAKFLYYRFLLIDWTSYNEASGVPSLNSSTIENIEILFPNSLEEQKAIVEILRDMDTEIQALQAKRSKYEKIKQGMMQELLTGKTRLI